LWHGVEQNDSNPLWLEFVGFGLWPEFVGFGLGDVAASENVTAGDDNSGR
jgi:hypothetical protein